MYNNDHMLFVNLLQALRYAILLPPAVLLATPNLRTPFHLSPGDLSPTPVLPALSGDILVFHDASFDCVSHHGGGAILIYDCSHQREHLIAVPIPIFVDSSFQAETFTAWQTLRALAADPIVAYTFALKDSPHHFTDSLSFITALRRRRPATCDALTDALLTSCQSLLKDLRAPALTHIRSHLDRNLLE